MSEKPCPFCGSDDVGCDGHYVYCATCHAEGPTVYPIPDHKKAIELWNRRAKEMSSE